MVAAKIRSSTVAAKGVVFHVGTLMPDVAKCPPPLLAAPRAALALRLFGSTSLRNPCPACALSMESRRSAPRKAPMPDDSVSRTDPASAVTHHFCSASRRLHAAPLRGPSRLAASLTHADSRVAPVASMLGKSPGPCIARGRAQAKSI
jgi:hypothetical protein